jgi:hypothetical protein
MRYSPSCSPPTSPSSPSGTILQDGAALKDANVGAVRPLVCDGGDAAVGVDFEEPGLFLLIGAHFDRVNLYYQRRGC